MNDLYAEYAGEETDYGAEDGRADALAGREPATTPGTDPYSVAYLAAYDAALAEICPDNIRPVT